MLGRLPINSVDALEISVVNEHPRFFEEFYNAISRLCGQITVTRRAKLVMRCDFTNFDLQRVNLTNLTVLDIHAQKVEQCRDWLLKVPCLQIFSVILTPDVERATESRYFYGNSVVPELVGHKLRHLVVRSRSVGKPIKSRLTSYTLCLVKSLRYLKRVSVSKTFARDVWHCVHETKDLFPHLIDVDVVMYHNEN